MSSSVNSLNDTTVNVPTSGTTDKGTKILRSTDNNMDKNSFLKILSAQLSNLDPTQNQDSSAYVSQMAQFAAMEQMQNLNTTMTDSAHQQMAGKTVITNEKDDNGSYVKGYVTQVIKRSGGTYLEILVNGKTQEVAAENIIGVVEATDANTSANSRAALNSDFLAASALADKGKNVVIATTDSDGKTVLVKGKVTGAYIDTVNGATVKIKIDVQDSNGNSTGETKTYDFGDIIRAGDLTSDEMKVSLDTTTNSSSSSSNSSTNTSSDSGSSNSSTNTNNNTSSDSTTNNPETDSTNSSAGVDSSSNTDGNAVAENDFLANYLGE